MRIIGIDPGSHVTGYGLIEKTGGQTVHVDNGCLSMRAGLSLPERLERIYSGLRDVLDKFRPDVAAIEQVFFSKNVASSLKLGESRGVALLAVTKQGLPIFEYSAREVKQALTGYGQATKEQVQKMVQRLLRLPETAQEDASDALAVALCHAQSQNYHSMLLKSERVLAGTDSFRPAKRSERSMKRQSDGGFRGRAGSPPDSKVA